jgi:hypothetical protein
MTRAVGDDEATITSLDEVAQLFDQAQNSVFKLMASVSGPGSHFDNHETNPLRRTLFLSL